MSTVPTEPSTHGSPNTGLSSFRLTTSRSRNGATAFMPASNTNSQKQNIVVTGGIDDIWVDMTTADLVVVDFKATSKKEEVSLDAQWQDGYKRQMEIYQWLFRKNDFKVSDTGHFVYCNGNTDVETFNSPRPG